MAIVLLHLSDIHIKGQQDKILALPEKIVSTIRSSLPVATHVFVVMSGDIAYSGKKDEYELAEKFVNEIVMSISSESNCDVSVIVAPGNHDCDFSKNTGARQGLISHLEKTAVADVDESIIDTCTAIQNDYLEFQRRIERHEVESSSDKLWRTSSFTVAGKVVEFNSLNVSWVSKIKEEPGHMLFPVDRYQSMLSDNAAIKIVVLHHPLNWFSQGVYRPFRKFIRNVANIIISGHEHQGNVGLIDEAESQKSAFIEGCVLQQDGGNIDSSSFNVVVIDLDDEKFKSTRYLWSGDHYSASEEGSWAEYHDLPAKAKSPFEIDLKFQGVLDDPGGFFRHPAGQVINLADIYVFPDLKRASAEDGRRDIVSSSALLSTEHVHNGVVIQGEEKSGATSLLFRLYRHYHEHGLLPVYVKGKDIKRATPDEIDGVVRRAIIAQYGKSNYEKISQLPKVKKIILVDDFDDGPMKAASHRASLLSDFKSRFGHVVVTVGALFEMREVLDGDKSNTLLSLEHYRIQQFGFKRRSELIQRWFSLGADGSDDEGVFISRCDQAEQLMNGVMVKALVPALPLYLLTLLQSIEAGISGDFKESSLGYYYQFLITQSFTESGVKESKLTEMFQYCCHLAWFFHTSDKKEMVESELREFNEKFSSEWSTMDFQQQLSILVNSRVLFQIGEEYSFRYPYIYYFLKGKFLSENLNDKDMKCYIEHCCEHLYVRDYANTILFLAHHTNDEFVVDSIAVGLMTSFKELKPVAFIGSDTSDVKKLIVDAPLLVYKGGKPAEHRLRRTELQDQMDDGGDGFSDCEETSALSFISKLTMLFKTADILGQVLKSQYAKIRKPRRTMLVEELISAPLRALGFFYREMSSNPDGLKAEIEAAIKKKGDVPDIEERKTIAGKVASELVQLVTFAFVYKAAQNVNSENLSENVSDAVKGDGSLSFRLVELAALLDSPKPIPRTLLKDLYKSNSDDIIISRLIRVLVFNRLYMFKTTESDMQWLSNELDIRLKMQHEISYIDSTQRKLK